MNGKQAILRLKASLNQLDTASNRTVRPELALLFLNSAYERLVDAKYQKLNSEDSTGFQFDQKTTDDLNHLTTPVEITPSKTTEGYEVDLTTVTDYSKHLRSSVKVKVNFEEYLISNINFKTLDTINTSYEDPFNVSNIRYPVAYFVDNKIKIVANDFEVSKYLLTYLRSPKLITLEEEIEAPFVQDIIDAAAVMILENWGDARTTTLVGVNKVIESN